MNRITSAVVPLGRVAASAVAGTADCAASPRGWPSAAGNNGAHAGARRQIEELLACQGHLSILHVHGGVTWAARTR